MVGTPLMASSINDLDISLLLCTPFLDRMTRRTDRPSNFNSFAVKKLVWSAAIRCIITLGLLFEVLDLRLELLIPL
jgi:hypothetical protein